MKKITEIILVCVIALTLCSCGNASRQGAEPPSSSAESITDTAASSAPTTKKENTLSKTTPKKTAAKPAHKHSFSAPTCTQAGKCSCGATNGSAKGHTWQNATCTAPKTCKVCGATEGGKTAHNISIETGKCTVCGAFEYNVNAALRFCMKKENPVNAAEYDSYRILNAYYVENKPCMCDVPHNDNYITVFIYFYSLRNGLPDKDLLIFDVHKTANGYESYYCSYPDIYFTANNNDELIKIRSGDYSIYYDEKSMKKVNLGEIL